MVKLKKCSKCGETKKITDFHLDATTPDLHRRWCKVCARTSALNHRNKDVAKARENCRRWSSANPDKEREQAKRNYPKNAGKMRNGYIKKTYGLTPEAWSALFDSQDRKCAICRTDDPGKSPFNAWATDHDHTTERLRGILCPKCNKGIGLLNDSPAQFIASIPYLCAGEVS